MSARIRIAVYTIIVAVITFLAGPAQAKYLGGVRPVCVACGNKPINAPVNAPSGTATSLSEGNFTETYGGPSIAGGSGAAVSLDLTFNSNLADGSNGRVNTILGVGWTHSYNVFLFKQRSEIFRFEGNGRVNKFTPTSSTSYRSTEGYFITLNRTSVGFTLHFNDGATHDFALVPGSPTLNGQQVYWLQKMTDRRGNSTTLAYTGGLLTSITNTYGRSLTLVYNAGRKLASIADPLGQVTTLQYDSTNTRLLRIVDPTGKTVNYTSNALYQITRKVDKDGRSFTFGYKIDKPVSVTDGAGASQFTQTNTTTNWATDSTALATQLMRLYIPSTTARTDGNGKVWQYDYDAGGYITRVRAPDGAVTSYTYDPATLNVATVTDANGNTTHYEYDAQGNLTKQTDALVHVTTWTYEPVFNQMTSMTDPNLRVTTYDIDPANGNRLKETDPLGGVRQWTYDSHGNVLTETDKNGNLTRHQYDAFGNRTKTTDAVGKPEERATTYTYDAVGNRKTRTDDNLHTTSYVYDGLNRLIEEADPAGAITRYAYDGQGNRVQVTDRNGNPTMFQYDLRQRLTKTTDALGKSTTQSYDGNDNRVSMTDKNGHATSFQYDVQNRLVKTTDALGNASTRAYDPVGNLLKQCDANGHCTAYAYDALNRRVTSLDAEGNLTRIGYEGDVVCLAIGCPTFGSSLVTRQIDANGKYTYFKYDGLDRLTTQIRKQTDTADSIDSDDAVTRYTYDANGNRLSLTEPNGNATRYVYDGLNRVVKETNAAGDETLTGYDGVGNVVTVTAPNLNVTANTYDALDRLIQVDDSVGRVANYTYDSEGNRLTEKDGNGNGTTNAYDAIYRLIQLTDALGNSTFYQYDPVGNLLKVTDREGRATCHSYDNINRRTLAVQKVSDTDCAVVDTDDIWTKTDYDHVGNVTALTTAKNGSSPAACNGASPPADCETTRYAYDGINRLVQETYPDPAPNTRSFSYDGVGNLLTRTDQKGQVTQYQYSDLYFLTQRSYPVSPADTLSYDLSGRMLTAERGGWPVTFAYDGANRVTQTTQNGKTVDYAYDIPGRTRSVTYPGGRQIVEHTDPRARLDTIDDAASPPPLAQYVYDLGNRVTSRAYRNGVAATYAYNPNNWITDLNYNHGATLIAGFHYDYDNEGNKRYEQKLHDTPRSEAYQYDDVYRLVIYKVGTLVGSTVPVPTTQSQYNLDKVGNWDSWIVNGSTETRTHNTVNEITSINGAPLTYDNNGNLKQDPRYQYLYDEENRLTRVTRISDSRIMGQYRYDALGRRIAKIANLTGVPVETRYFYDDARIVEEQDAGGATLATYVYGNYIDEVLTMDRGGQTYYYHQNALWSVAAVTDGAANVAERYSYDAYGFATITDGSGTLVPVWDVDRPRSAIGNPWMFTGRQLDEESGLYYYRARYYDGLKGRFLGRDPAGYIPGLNLYEYLRGRPLFFLDPFGLLTGSSHVEGGAGTLLTGQFYWIKDYFWSTTDVLNQTENVFQTVINNCASSSGTQKETETTIRLSIRTGTTRTVALESGTEKTIQGGYEAKGFSIEASKTASEKSGFTLEAAKEVTKEIEHKVAVPCPGCSKIEVWQQFDKTTFTGKGFAVFSWAWVWWNTFGKAGSSGDVTLNWRDTGVEKRWKDNFEIKTVAGKCEGVNCTF